MRLETKAKVDDLVRAADLIQSALVHVSREQFLANWEKQSAVERQFIIIGEALVRIRDLEPSVFARIPNSRAVIAFRNILVHGYDIADPETIYELAGEQLSGLRDSAHEIAGTE